MSARFKRATRQVSTLKSVSKPVPEEKIEFIYDLEIHPQLPDERKKWSKVVVNPSVAYQPTPPPTPPTAGKVSFDRKTFFSHPIANGDCESNGPNGSLNPPKIDLNIPRPNTQGAEYSGLTSHANKEAKYVNAVLTARDRLEGNSGNATGQKKQVLAVPPTRKQVEERNTFLTEFKEQHEQARQKQEKKRIPDAMLSLDKKPIRFQDEFEANVREPAKKKGKSTVTERKPMLKRGERLQKNAKAAQDKYYKHHPLPDDWVPPGQEPVVSAVNVKAQEPTESKLEARGSMTYHDFVTHQIAEGLKRDQEAAEKEASIQQYVKEREEREKKEKLMRKAGTISREDWEALMATQKKRERRRERRRAMLYSYHPDDWRRRVKQGLPPIPAYSKLTPRLARTIWDLRQDDKVYQQFQARAEELEDWMKINKGRQPRHIVKAKHVLDPIDELGISQSERLPRRRASMDSHYSVDVLTNRAYDNFNEIEQRIEANDQFIAMLREKRIRGKQLVADSARATMRSAQRLKDDLVTLVSPSMPGKGDSSPTSPKISQLTLLQDLDRHRDYHSHVVAKVDTGAGTKQLPQKSSVRSLPVMPRRQASLLDMVLEEEPEAQAVQPLKLSRRRSLNAMIDDVHIHHAVQSRKTGKVSVMQVNVTKGKQVGRKVQKRIIMHNH